GGGAGGRSSRRTLRGEPDGIAGQRAPAAGMNDGMNDAALTPDRILDAAEEVLRRYGPQKTTVVDVARALDVSHGTIYRHYPSKQALRDAVTRRWLHRVTVPLQRIAEERGPAAARLHPPFQALLPYIRLHPPDRP